MGTGPKNSPEVLVSTAEDVPSLAPSSLTCSSSSSTSLTLSWQPPPPEAMHGVLTAFTVYYRAMREWEVGKVVKESTQDKGLTLTGLQPYQNYTLQVSDLYLCKCLPKDPTILRIVAQKGGGSDICRRGNAKRVGVLQNQVMPMLYLGE